MGNPTRGRVTNSSQTTLQPAAYSHDLDRSQFPQLNDGGAWVRCTGCDTYKRHEKTRAMTPRETGCAECGSAERHVPDTPSYAVDD